MGKYRIEGAVKGVVINLTIPDDTPAQEVADMLDMIQRFANTFDSAKEFAAAVIASLETSGEFSVVQFFEDGTSEYVRRMVSDEEAWCSACNVATRMGLVKRVIITDAGDCCCFEWIHGKGVTFP